jgi:hypothetical protein
MAMRRVTDFFSPRKKAAKRKQDATSNEEPLPQPALQAQRDPLFDQTFSGLLDAPWSPPRPTSSDQQPEGGGVDPLEDIGVNLDEVLAEMVAQNPTPPEAAVGFFSLQDLENGLLEEDAPAEPIPPPSAETVLVPVASKDRVREKAKLLKREELEKQPGKLNYQPLVQSRWVKDHPWHYVKVDPTDQNRAKLGCRLCKKHKADSMFARSGSVSFKTDALVQHAASPGCSHPLAAMREVSKSDDGGSAERRE